MFENENGFESQQNLKLIPFFFSFFMFFFYIYKKVSKNQGQPVLHHPNPNHNKAKKNQIKLNFIAKSLIVTYARFHYFQFRILFLPSSKKIKIKIQEININFPFICNLESRVFFEC